MYFVLPPFTDKQSSHFTKAAAAFRANRFEEAEGLYTEATHRVDEMNSLSRNLGRWQYSLDYAPEN